MSKSWGQEVVDGDVVDEFNFGTEQYCRCKAEQDFVKRMFYLNGKGKKEVEAEGEEE